ncbi:hypothetical protein, partial [Massilia sp. ST3]|uniref:hypothetical protein n=1 Tax=Massilia sp. ST3 TaxID=2824903 RepID=UPI001B82104C
AARWLAERDGGRDAADQDEPAGAPEHACGGGHGVAHGRAHGVARGLAQGRAQGLAARRMDAA